MGGLFGAPVALDAMDQYYDYVCENYGLSAKTVLEGFSRGGLYAFNCAGLSTLPSPPNTSSPSRATTRRSSFSARTETPRTRS